MGERLLAINMFAGAHRGDRRNRMRMIRRADRDGVERFLLLEHLPKIFVTFGVRIRSVSVRGAIVIYGAQRDTIVGLRAVEIVPTASAGADDADIEFVVSRY